MAPHVGLLLLVVASCLQAEVQLPKPRGKPSPNKVEVVNHLPERVILQCDFKKTISALYSLPTSGRFFFFVCFSQQPQEFYTCTVWRDALYAVFRTSGSSQNNTFGIKEDGIHSNGQEDPHIAWNHSDHAQPPHHSVIYIQARQRNPIATLPSLSNDAATANVKPGNISQSYTSTVVMSGNGSPAGSSVVGISSNSQASGVQNSAISNLVTGNLGKLLEVSQAVPVVNGATGNVVGISTSIVKEQSSTSKNKPEDDEVTEKEKIRKVLKDQLTTNKDAQEEDVVTQKTKAKKKKKVSEDQTSFTKDLQEDKGTQKTKTKKKVTEDQTTAAKDDQEEDDVTQKTKAKKKKVSEDQTMVTKDDQKEDEVTQKTKTKKKGSGDQTTTTKDDQKEDDLKKSS